MFFLRKEKATSIFIKNYQPLGIKDWSFIVHGKFIPGGSNWYKTPV